MSGKPLTHAERGRLGGMKAVSATAVPPQPPCSLAAWQRWRAPIAE